MGEALHSPGRSSPEVGVVAQVADAHATTGILPQLRKQP
jgi:hypothetical protein